MIFAVLDVSWTMGLNNDKISEVFFVLIVNINVKKTAVYTQVNGEWHI